MLMYMMKEWHRTTIKTIAMLENVQMYNKAAYANSSDDWIQNSKLDQK